MSIAGRALPGDRSTTLEARPLVLVVDDYEDAREMYALHLESEGYRVACAANGEEAVATAMALRPAAIVMDLALPVMEGWTATRILKGHPETARIPVIAVSGHVLPDCKQRALDAGCDVFLAKPCIPSDVAAEVAKAIARSA